MGLIYISISISGFFVLYAFLISIGMINTKFVMTNYNKLLFISYSITTIFSIVVLFVYYSWRYKCFIFDIMLNKPYF